MNLKNKINNKYFILLILSMSYEVEPQLIESFEPELYNEFVTIFKTYDKNGNAVIEKNEFVDLLHALGCTDIDAKEAETLYKDIDLNNDSVISFNEFLHIMKKMKPKSKKKKSKK